MNESKGMKNRDTTKEIIVAIFASLLIIVFASAILFSGAIAIPPQPTNRPLASFYLRTTYNWEFKWLWSSSPEVVTSILWDHRGIDTVYETSVFFFAIIGALMLIRSYKGGSKYKAVGMSIIARSITKITLVSIPVIALSMALHGHLTPGGGFQGGSVFAISTLLAIIALGLGFFMERRWTKHRLLGLRTMGLMIIGFIAISLPIIGFFKGYSGYIMQNQWKPWSPLGFGYVFNLFGIEILYSGSLLFLNLAEFLAVSAGLTLAFIALALPKEDIRKGGGLDD